MNNTYSFDDLRSRIDACRICEKMLPHSPRPVTSWALRSRILIIGQAPGRIVHESGVPWQDASGLLLRKWLSVSEEQFYDTDRFGIVPMGFCYPGKGRSGDLPPRPECAPEWHHKIFNHLKDLKLILLIGQYAQNYYLGDKGYKTLTKNVLNYKRFLPRFMPLPHPSPRNRPWLHANPWFEKELVPELQKRVESL